MVEFWDDLSANLSACRCVFELNCAISEKPLNKFPAAFPYYLSVIDEECDNENIFMTKFVTETLPITDKKVKSQIRFCCVKVILCRSLNIFLSMGVSAKIHKYIVV